MSNPGKPSSRSRHRSTASPGTGDGDNPPGEPPARLVLHYPVTTRPADDLCSDLARRAGLSKTRIKQAMTKGAVWIKRQRGRRRRVRRATTRPMRGDRIELYYDAAILDRQPPEPECIHDHRCYSVWYKPAGMLTQGTHFSDHCSLLRAAQKAFDPQRRVWPVHRLDREAQGLVLIAHDRRTAGSLSRLFRRRQITKGYYAVLKGRLETSHGLPTISAPLDGKPAITRYRVIHHDARADQTHVEVWIETGRRHQIRRHFDGIGHPLMGDPRYGRNNHDPDGLKLWAFALAFICPQCRQPHTYERPPTLAAGNQCPRHENAPGRKSHHEPEANHRQSGPGS